MKINFRPWTTLFLVTISIITTFAIGTFDDSLFGEQNQLLYMGAFNPLSPFANSGLPLILSPFSHISSEHLMINILFFIPIAAMIERHSCGQKLITSFIFIHIFVLITLFIFSFTGFIPNSHFLGLSHIIIGLATYWGMVKKSRLLLCLVFASLVVGGMDSGLNLSLISHILGSLSALFLFAFKRSFKSTNSSL